MTDQLPPPPASRAPDKAPRGPVVSGVGHVWLAIVVFFTLLVLFDARGLYFWSSKLPVSEAAKTVRALAEQHWQQMSRWGLEEPKHSLEGVFLDFQEAHPLLYPRKYPEYAAKRKEQLERASRPKDAKAEAWRVTDTRKSAGRKGRVEARARAGKPRLLIVGDSIMVSVGPVIKKDVEARLGGSGEVIARVATGLSRPDVFDWRRELESAVTEAAYDYLVVMMGTNDSQDFAESGTILSYGTQEWVRAYNRRLATLMATACRGVRRAIWVGLPPMKSEAFNRKVIRINNWAKRQAQRSKCVEYVAVEQIVGDAQGHYTAYRKIGEHLEKIRAVDGIHVTSRGGELISQALLSRIASELSMAD